MAIELKIAVIDDHSFLRKGICSIMEKIEGPYKLRVIFDESDGLEMISQIKKGKIPDVVFLDINMPGMDGIQTCHWIQANYPDIIVIALTMYDTPHIVARMIKNGAKGFLRKDIEPHEISIAIQEIKSKGYYYTDFLTESLIKAVKDGSVSIDNFNSKASAKAREKFDNLRNNEKEFLKLLCSEQTYETIAVTLGISPKTLDGYRARLFELFEVNSRTGLVLYLVKNDLVDI